VPSRFQGATARGSDGWVLMSHFSICFLFGVVGGFVLFCCLVWVWCVFVCVVCVVGGGGGLVFVCVFFWGGVWLGGVWWGVFVFSGLGGVHTRCVEETEVVNTVVSSTEGVCFTVCVFVKGWLSKRQQDEGERSEPSVGNGQAPRHHRCCHMFFVKLGSRRLEGGAWQLGSSNGRVPQGSILGTGGEALVFEPGIRWKGPATGWWGTCGLGNAQGGKGPACGGGMQRGGQKSLWCLFFVEHQV